MTTISCESETIATLHLDRPGQPRITGVLRENECLAVGSDETNDICFIDEDVASTHCMISAKCGVVSVRDCFSGSGTFVDKVRIRETQLTSDCQIQIGRNKILVKLSHCIPTQTPAIENAASAERQSAVERVQNICESAAVDKPESRESRTADSPFATIGNLEQQLQEAKAVIEVLQNRLAAAVAPESPAPSVDPYQEEMLQLLRDEILELQAALADRDQDGSGTACLSEPDSHCDDMLSKGDSEKLVDRLEQLLQELQQRDEQISTLTELLEAAEAANRAEQEERSQIDSWLRDIEQRCSDREQEWRSEKSKLQTELAAIADERNNAESALNGDSSSVKLEAAQNLMRSLRETAESQRQKLNDAEQTIAQLQRELESTKHAQPREERMQLAEERSEIARLRQELEQERQRKQNGTASDDSIKFQALRKHLNEIHEQERKEREERKLSSRIARLWSRLDGR
jgi:pSer/pThr/pTyr-binding forkhead associated (FHA) protein